MIDREKVITALQLELEYPYSWECAAECPYYGKTDCDCFDQVTMDALALIKEQVAQIDLLEHVLAKAGLSRCANGSNRRIEE